jgi:hypothetical protein
MMVSASAIGMGTNICLGDYLFTHRVIANYISSNLRICVKKVCGSTILYILCPKVSYCLPTIMDDLVSASE